MPLQELTRARWPDFFDEISRSLRAQRVKVEVTGLGLGDGVAADWIPLDGLSYEAKEDALTVFAQGLEHRIRHPRRIHVDRDPASLHSLEAIDADGNYHIVQLSAPLALPQP